MQAAGIRSSTTMMVSPTTTTSTSATKTSLPLQHPQNLVVSWSHVLWLFLFLPELPVFFHPKNKWSLLYCIPITYRLISLPS